MWKNGCPMGNLVQKLISNPGRVRDMRENMRSSNGRERPSSDAQRERE